jgi:hypothetical protein
MERKKTMIKRVSIFVSIMLLGFCQSATAMGRHLRYRKKLSSARPVRASLQRERCTLSIQSPLFIHAVVQAAQTTEHKAAFGKYVNELVQSNRRAGNWTSISDSKKFYEHVVTHIPWNGKHKDGRSYPLLLNEREVTIQALCYQSKCVSSVYHTEIFSLDNLLENEKHHEKICQQFDKFIELPVANSFGIPQREYDNIRHAVFAKKGREYAKLFDDLYPHATHESVIALSKEFDEGSCRSWQECYPPRSHAYVNGQKFWIDGKIGAMIYDYQNS